MLLHVLLSTFQCQQAIGTIYHMRIPDVLAVELWKGME